MTIYELIFGQSSGQVCCVFHDDTRASAGISDIGQYNCFACGTKAGNEIGFIMQYFGVSFRRASTIKYGLERIENFKYIRRPLSQEQKDYLHSCGITDEVIKEHMFQTGKGKLTYRHTFNGIPVGYTWFNAPQLSNHSVSDPKYKYVGGTVAGMLTPYDTVLKYPRLIICEGEKDMLTALSYGIPNAVAKIGGAQTPIVAGINLNNKDIIIVYDCDDAGREGAEQDAYTLQTEYGCRVKIVDLGLQDKEDLNDYFVKYGKSKDDFYQLITSTPLFVATPKIVKSKVERLIDDLSDDELIQLKNLLEEKEHD